MQGVFARNLERLLITFVIGALLLVGAGETYAAPGQAQATLFVSPRSGTVLENSTFDLSFFVNSHGAAINAIELNLKFPADKLTIVKPSGGKSFITLWVAPPSYSNTSGTVTFSGVVPGGITTEAGLISTITFQAIASGDAFIQILPSSRVLANDGSGTSLVVEFGNATFTITPRPPDGVQVFSETHPFPEEWYNNNNPIFTWEKLEKVTDFSYVFDNKPLTTPDNTPETEDTIASYEDQADGVWYFHIKARKDGVWGNTTHFRAQIDTVSPAEFRPETEIAKGPPDKVVVSFFTTDTLSGIDHYEIGVVNRTDAPDVSPIFLEVESPYQLPTTIPENARVMVRAFDRAGNVRDERINVEIPGVAMSFIRKNLTAILGLLLLIILLLILSHFLFRHKIIALVRHVVRIIRRERKVEQSHEEKHDKEHERHE